ncbi:MAG: hypothetical protein P8Y94_14780 [Acidobacteriota bacterium]
MSKPHRELSGGLELKSLVTICSCCRRIRVEEGRWRPLGPGDFERGKVEFSHGICADCAGALYPQFFTKPR